MSSPVVEVCTVAACVSSCSGSQQPHIVHMCKLSDVLWQSYTLMWCVVQGLRCYKEDNLKSTTTASRQWADPQHFSWLEMCNMYSIGGIGHVQLNELLAMPTSEGRGDVA